jgi:hypothetical protein
MKKNTEISQKVVLTEKSEKEYKHIKLHIPGESFWAMQLSEDTAQIDNILLNSDYGLKDIVKFNPEDNEVISVIEKKTNTFGIKYPEEGDVKETYKTLYNYFESKNIHIEGMFSGVALLSIPVGIPSNAVEQIVAECPFKIEFLINEDEEESK